jgi:transcriptional regulator with XRE-family HTH domain
MARPTTRSNREALPRGVRPVPQAPADDAVLTKALLRASELLGLSGSALARVLGVSEASISRLASGARTIHPDSKEGELALLLVRLYRSLDTLVGADEGLRRAWMGGTSTALNGRPIDLITRAEGLVGVVAYLDAMRAPG